MDDPCSQIGVTNQQQNYRQYLAGIRACAYLKPIRLKYKAAYALTRALSPRREEVSLVKSQMLSCANSLSKGVEECWQDYLWHASTNTLNTYLYRDMHPGWLGSVIEVRGASHLHDAIERRRGVLVLSGHQHSLMQVAVTLGLMKLRTHPILMDPQLTVPEYLEDYATRAVRDSSLHFNGGNYIFVDYGGAFVRPVYRTLSDGQVVLSANDFPASLAPKRRLVMPFLGRYISCPTGSVEIANSCSAAVVPGFVKRGKHGLAIEFHKELSGSTEDMMRAYAGILEETVRADPGGWEGWKWPDVFVNHEGTGT